MAVPVSPASPAPSSDLYIALAEYGATEPQESRETSLQKCAEKCKAVAKKAFDVIALLSGLALAAGGSVLIIGEAAGVQPNRGAGLGSLFLGLIIAESNIAHIRNWNSCF